MRLLDTSTLKLSTWFSDEDEVTFQELQSLNDALQCPCRKNDRDQRVRGKKGYDKIAAFCRLAGSTLVASETINSMYKWYRSSRVCYVYLVDVPRVNYSNDEPLILFKASEWFRRGWTLQELLAPQQHKYLAQDWSLIGVTVRNTTSDTSATLDSGECSCATSFPGATCLETGSFGSLWHTHGLFQKLRPQWKVCIAERMSWAAKRETSRLEDKAYCLLGIFNINMALIYGEGEKAFVRLQEEIIQHYVDRTILAWDRTDHESTLSPKDFKFTNFRFRNRTAPADEVHEITSQGLLSHMEVADHPTLEDTLLARLDHSHTFTSSQKQEYQILMVLPIVSDIHDFDLLMRWISTRRQETHVHCPRELVAVDLETLQGRPWSFKRRKLCISRWRIEHWKMDPEEGIVLRHNLMVRSFMFLSIQVGILTTFLTKATTDIVAAALGVLCLPTLIFSWISIRQLTISRIDMLSLPEALDLYHLTEQIDYAIVILLQLAVVIVQSMPWILFTKGVFSGRVQFAGWIWLTRQATPTLFVGPIGFVHLARISRRRTLKCIKIRSRSTES
ncbi:hypothetical protein PV05_03246 [Exophiala xenobiotica]|uniref:DUF8212 domain-containing protein n=1 Tax=Exophiala xenobiotica TaxID=348802 RepID=A0A0D2ESP2_9EURO|nr:uncharacterized protein PV05_03246 [Exophiala xenobiotica]KIW58748.1 hypothetical protein PV05_03246 [Exophiala xenobiotica]